MTDRIVIDACVFVSATQRVLTVGAARAGLFQPVWSARIFEEWTRAAGRQGHALKAEARTDQALLTSAFPNGCVPATEAYAGRFHLPDPDDVHVLAAAVAGGAGALLTANTRDFPLRVMAAVGILRRHPDEFLLEIGLSAPEVLRPLIAAHHEAVGSGRSPRTFLRRSGLARLGKWYAP